MWVGNESLSISARLYRPAERQWRAHVLSSADRRVCWAEEGGGATNYTLEVSDETWSSYTEAAKGESVRCLRNIGTYYDESEGTVKDITGAPYKVRPQNYFTITPEPNENLAGVVDDPSTHYVFSFDRLNPKSLREFTEGDLPFNDQYSINNCAYLKMETQSRNDELLLMDTEGNYYPDYAYPYSISLDVLNEEINTLGFNPYCPPGYRFPNQVENLLMSVYLPESFYIKDPYNDSYPESTVYMPTRTYFDRGCYGKNTEGFEYDRQGFNGAKNREQQKVGWTYNTNSKKNTAARKTYTMSRSRCVRDVNMTGTIEGGLLMQNDLYPGDQVPLSFSFYSSGSTFISASLKFCYTDGSGVYHERDIPVQTAPSGLQYLANQTVKLPTIAEMGLEDMPLSSAKPKFKVTLRNAYVSKTFDQPVTLSNPLSGDITLIGEEAYPADASQISFDVSSAATACKLKSRKLSLAYTDKDGAPQTVVLLATDSPIAPVSTDSLTYKRTKQPITIPNLSTLNLTQANVDALHDATLVLEVEDNGGSKAEFTRSIKLANPLSVDSITLSDATGDTVYPEDKNHISLGAQSKANTINLSGVTIVIVPEGGSAVSITLPGDAPSSKVYSLTDGEITIPALASLSGVSASDLDTGKNATLRVSYTAGDYSKTVEKALTLSHPVVATSFTIDAIDDVKIYPADQNNVSLDFSSLGNTLTLSTATLQLYQGDTPVGSPIINGATINDKDYDWSGAITIPSLNDLGLDASALSPGTAFSLKALVTSSATGISKTLAIPLTLSNPVSGTMAADASIYPNDGASITIDFASAAHNLDLDNATLQLYNGESLIHTFDLTGNLPSGKTYTKTPLALSIPALSSLDSPLNGTNFEPTDLTLKLTVTTENDLSYTVQQLVTMRSHINNADFKIQKGATIPIIVNIGLTGSTNSISSATLLWSQDSGVNWTSKSLNPSLAQQTVQTTTDLPGFTQFVSNTSSETSQSVLYKLTVECTDGTSITTPVGSMTVLDYGFEPNNNVFYSYQDNLHFSNGDFIEASIDITGKTSSTYNKDEMIGFGAGTDLVETFHTGTANNAAPDITLHVFYRTDLNDKNLRFGGWYQNTSGYKSTDVQFDTPYLVIRLDKEGIYYNGSKASLRSELVSNLNTILASDHLLVGAAQGNQSTIRSNAHYNYINVARQPYQEP